MVEAVLARGSNVPIGWLVSILAIFAVIAIIAWAFSKTQRLKRALRSLPITPIAQLAENTLGRVVGRAKPVMETLHGPLTGRPCVYYIARVEQHVSSGKHGHWKTIIEESRGVPFVLVDASGRAIVDPSNADVALDFDSKSTSGTFDGANEVEEAFLQRHGAESKGWIFNKSLRYTEALIEVDETVAVLGQGVREPDPTSMPSEGYRSGPATLLRLTSSANHPLVISDDRSTVQ